MKQPSPTTRVLIKEHQSNNKEQQGSMVQFHMPYNKQPEDSNNNHHQNQNTGDTNNDINLIEENLKLVADIHKRAQGKRSPQQKAIEAVTAFLGRPRFLFIILFFVTLWIAVSLLLSKFGLHSLDSPPFNWLQLILAFSGLLMTTVVLITQNRQDKVEERHTQLRLQINLLLDQKMSKLIEMMDEERQNRSRGKQHDPQAEAMKETTDPHEALSTLEQLVEETEETL